MLLLYLKLLKSMTIVRRVLYLLSHRLFNPLHIRKKQVFIKYLGVVGPLIYNRLAKQFLVLYQH